MMKTVMKYLKSKTLLFGFLLSILGVVEINIQMFQNYMTAELFGWFSLIVGISVSVLRYITTTSLDEK